MKELNVSINQILSLYDFLGDDLNIEYFEDVEKGLKKEESIKKIEDIKEPPKQDKPQEEPQEVPKDLNSSMGSFISISENSDENLDKDYI